MTPAHDYLTDLAHAFVAGRSEPLPRPAGLDWHAFFRAAAAHEVLGTFVDLIDTTGLAPALRDEVAWLRRTVGMRSAVMLAELDRCLPALEEAGCRPIVLKGAALSRTVYPAVERRHFSDLDLLVPPDRIDRACEVLSSMDFRLVVGDRSPRFYERHHFPRILANPAGVCLEVHWSLTLPRSCYQFDLEAFAARTAVVETGGGTMRVPSAADQLLHGVVQCIADGFSDLRRIVDAALLVPRIEDVDLLASTARRQGMDAGLWLLLRLAHRLAGAEPPARLLAELRPGNGRRRCLEACDPPRACLDRRGSSDNGFTPLLHVLCTATGAATRREIRRWFLPVEADLMDAGFVPGRDPVLPRWLAMTGYRLRRGVQAGAWLGWRVARC